MSVSLHFDIKDPLFLLSSLIQTQENNPDCKNVFPHRDFTRSYDILCRLTPQDHKKLGYQPELFPQQIMMCLPIDAGLRIKKDAARRSPQKLTSEARRLQRWKTDGRWVSYVSHRHQTLHQTFIRLTAGMSLNFSLCLGKGGGGHLVAWLKWWDWHVFLTGAPAIHVSLIGAWLSHIPPVSCGQVLFKIAFHRSQTSQSDGIGNSSTVRARHPFRQQLSPGGYLFTTQLGSYRVQR